MIDTFSIPHHIFCLGCSSMVGMWFENGPYTVEKGAGWPEAPLKPEDQLHHSDDEHHHHNDHDHDHDHDHDNDHDDEHDDDRDNHHHHNPTKSPVNKHKTPSPTPIATPPPTDEEPGKPPLSSPIDVPPVDTPVDSPVDIPPVPPVDTVPPVPPIGDLPPPIATPPADVPPMTPPVDVDGSQLPTAGEAADGAASIMARTRQMQDQPPLPKYHLKRNPWSWSESANMIFLEQPLRTGFSKAAAGAHNIDNEDEVASDFFKFMQSFLTVFPEYQGLPVYITGESYGGMYIPWIAQHIVKTQTNNEWEKKFYPGAPDLIPINLQGVAIGNGVIDEETQDATYPEYAYTHGLIPLEAKEFADSQFEKCREKLDKKTRTRSLINHGDISDCDVMGLVRSN